VKRLKGPSDRIDVKTRAFHEAGHTVVAVARGIPYKHVTLVPRTNRDGGHIALDWKEIRTELRKGNTKLRSSLWVFYHAGVVAQLFYKPESPVIAGNKDFEALEGELGSKPLQVFIHDKKADAYRVRTPAQIRAALRRRSACANRTAIRVIAHYWPFVKLIARALVKNKTLSRTEVDAVVMPAMARFGLSGKDTAAWRQTGLRQSPANRHGIREQES
jgi:hypothetical protein